jgi:hypothetical protein
MQSWLSKIEVPFHNWDRHSERAYARSRVGNQSTPPVTRVAETPIHGGIGQASIEESAGEEKVPREHPGPLRNLSRPEWRRQSCALRALRASRAATSPAVLATCEASTKIPGQHGDRKKTDRVGPSIQSPRCNRLRRRKDHSYVRYAEPCVVPFRTVGCGAFTRCLQNQCAALNQTG